MPQTPDEIRARIADCDAAIARYEAELLEEILRPIETVRKTLTEAFQEQQQLPTCHVAV